MNSPRLWGAALAFLIVAGLAWWFSTRTPPAPPPVPPPAPPAAEGPSPDLIAHLARGVNLSNWLQQGKPAEAQRYAPDDADFARIKALGLAHVRILFDPAALLDERGLLRGDAVAQLRAAIDAAIAQDLVVVLALQLPQSLKPAVAADAAQREALGGTWRALARALGGISPARLVLEPLNEDGIADPAQSRAQAEFFIAQIRSVLPQHTLVVEGHAYADIDELVAMRPLADANLVYSFHFYRPHDFTHQGASWGDPRWRRLRGVRYPGADWNRDKIAAEIGRAAAWAKAQHVTLWCSEFGAMKLRAAPADRAAWLRDVREALEGQHIAWTHWDYAGPFGIVSGARGHRVPDASAIQALGLKGPG